MTTHPPLDPPPVAAFTLDIPEPDKAHRANWWLREHYPPDTRPTWGVLPLGEGIRLFCEEGIDRAALERAIEGEASA